MDEYEKEYADWIETLAVGTEPMSRLKRAAVCRIKPKKVHCFSGRRVRKAERKAVSNFRSHVSQQRAEREALELRRFVYEVGRPFARMLARVGYQEAMKAQREEARKGGKQNLGELLQAAGLVG